MASREICKLCYGVSRVGFRVSDSVWEQVVPASALEQSVCLDCFTRLADERLLPWDRAITFFPVSLATHMGGQT